MAWICTVKVVRPPSEHFDRQTTVEEQGASCPRSGLRELLGGHHAERETGVDEGVRQ